ncbi:hypothetical protein GLAREA_04748 [Glarea lozoyensis ATCC 20868]|uniref:BTB domain-containing protein n=1 Tax=Glarea lozoyensis (strain ATCC 20868 / MF5171) TaxID=1116229 RepID=S3CN99_GLAL2|nr:uncharacterized protein GLAREA_04748 [Glarea lozoyensis ATCC 20868]EPE27957.1 hypothetical protein GLAREA_04748 [Glarea lozoyensis ATCC 20868]
MSNEGKSHLESTVLNSRLFTFEVGENLDGKATEIRVRQEAIAQLSRPLCLMMTGHHSESQAGRTVWKDVSKETFEQFAQFAYTGDYFITAPVLREFDPEEWKEFDGSLDESQEEKEYEEEGKGLPPGKKRKRSEKGATGKLITLSDLTFARPERQRYWKVNRPATYYDSKYDYTQVLLCHASLYILGDLWLVEPLKKLALHKLQKTLNHFHIDKYKIRDVIHLLRVVYGEEGRTGPEGFEGGLAQLVCAYLAMHGEFLRDNENFIEFMGEGGQFVKDVWRLGIGK